jgi:hypothetical protein
MRHLIIGYRTSIQISIVNQTYMARCALVGSMKKVFHGNFAGTKLDNVPDKSSVPPTKLR